MSGALLRCRECGLETPAAAAAVCASCWGALEPAYDLARARQTLTRASLAARDPGLGRYRELLPAAPARPAGGTRLHPAPSLGARLGIRDLFVKFEGAPNPTGSFKDRLVAVALGQARALGIDTVGCGSTGNLARAVAAGAAAAGLRAVLLVPASLPSAERAALARAGAVTVAVRGDYDRVNRLATQVSDRYGWGFVNANLRAYYVEGGKTVLYETAEALGWRLPRHLVVPVGGGGLFASIDRACGELRAVGLVGDEPCALHAAQAGGAAPVVEAWAEGRTEPRPRTAATRVHSLAIGDPPDGPAVLAALRRTGGRAEAPGDDDAFEGVRLLEEREGLRAEAAGGVVVAAARTLAAGGAFHDGGAVVLVVTGAAVEPAPEPEPSDAHAAVVIDGTLDAFDAYWRSHGETRPA
jgi:threonine synthase